MFRDFKVGNESVKDKTTHKDKITAYFVTDANDNSEVNDRPKAASFPISQVFHAELQHQRAKDYCDYLNKLVEASKQSYEQNQLINVLKS